jgi:diaminopimelate decarboxylase
MPEGFYRDASRSLCDGVSLADLAAAHGTPLYVYSAPLVRATYQALDRAFGGRPHAIHYALKANSALAIARLLRELGAGADANSAGEIDVALRAGFAPDQIVFTGVGKTEAELARAIAIGVKAINAESAGELARIDQMAGAAGRRARVALRVNPDIDAGTHPHISTGLHINKFGVALDDAQAIFRERARWPHLSVVAIHMHVGSQVTAIEPIARAAALMATTVQALHASGVHLEYVDLGGGLGISYDGAAVPTAAQYVEALAGPLAALGDLPIVIEPGRAIIGPAGVLVARVVDVKRRAIGERQRCFVVLDAGMTELMRPALYGAFHRIEPIVARDASPVPCEIVGPICESTDVIGAERMLPPPDVGDLMVIRDTGAYGFAMASNYLRRPFPAEVLVDNGGARIIRRRQTIDDLLALEG